MHTRPAPPPAKARRTARVLVVGAGVGGLSAAALLAHAGLDVFLNEPHPDPALTALPNVTLYPHHASGTEETRDRMAQLTVDNLDAFFAGRPLLTPVN